MAGKSEKQLVLLIVLLVAGLILLGGIAPQTIPTAPNSKLGTTASGQMQLVVEAVPRTTGSGAVILEVSPAS